MVSGYAWFLNDITNSEASTVILVNVEFVRLEKMFLFLKVEIEGYFILLFPHVVSLDCGLCVPSVD